MANKPSMNIIQGSISHSGGEVGATFDVLSSTLDVSILYGTEGAELVYIGVVADRKGSVARRYRLIVRGDDQRFARVRTAVEYAIQGNQAKCNEYLAFCA